jgi:hypothetical protein
MVARRFTGNLKLLDFAAGALSKTLFKKAVLFVTDRLGDERPSRIPCRGVAETLHSAVRIRETATVHEPNVD